MALAALALALVLTAAVATSPGLRRWARPPLERLGLLQPYQAGDHYQSIVERHLRDNSNLRAPCVVLLGDSLTEDFPTSAAAPRAWAVRGIAGDRVRHVAARLDSAAVSAPCATVAVLAGTNDVVMDGADPEDVARQVASLASVLRASGKDVLLATVPPVRDRFTNANARIGLLNELLRDLARARGLVLVDLHTALVDGSGALDLRYSRDGLHLTEAGYERWTELLVHALIEEARDSR